jgi:hypothetical protein
MAKVKIIGGTGAKRKKRIGEPTSKKKRRFYEDGDYEYDYEDDDEDEDDEVEHSGIFSSMLFILVIVVSVILIHNS